MMLIEVLGAGCAKCNKLEMMVRTAVKELRIEANVEKIEDMTEIASRAVPMTPALFIDGVLVCSGSIPDVEAIKQVLREKIVG